MIDALKPSSGPSSRGFHRLALYAACPQKFVYSQLRHLEPLRMSEPLALGSMLHLALMHHYLAKMGRESLDPIEAMRSAPARMAYCFERAKSVFTAYREWSAIVDAQWDLLDVERQFEVNVAGSLYTQRADLVVRSKADSKVYLVDHKCLMSTSVATLPKWRLLDGQNYGYDLLGRALIGRYVYENAVFGGVFLNLIKCSAPFAFKRHPLPISNRLREAFIDALAASIDGMDRVESRLVGSIGIPFEAERRGLINGICQGRYDACEYTELCLRGESAMPSYQVAVDQGTRVKEGSGR